MGVHLKSIIILSLLILAANFILLSDKFISTDQVFAKITSKDDNFHKLIFSSSILPSPHTPPPTPSPYILKNHVFEISKSGNYLIYDYPSIYLITTQNFTIELMYKTPSQPNVQEEVMIFGNERYSPAAEPYGRFFSLLLNPLGKVILRFGAGDFQTPEGGHTQGKLESSFSIDDNEWHHLAVVRDRSLNLLELYIDQILVGNLTMKTGIDVEDQEERTLIGGGNDMHYRNCSIDQVKIWKKKVEIHKSSLSSCQKDLIQDEDLIAYFPFEDEKEGVLERDYSLYKGDALRVGDIAKTIQTYVEDSNLVQCRIPVYQDNLKDFNPNNISTHRAVIITSLIFNCQHSNVFDPGDLFIFETYFGILWLDARRLGQVLIVFYHCMPDSYLSYYSSPNVFYVNMEKLLSPHQLACHPVLSRFLAYDTFLKSSLNNTELSFVQQMEWIVHIDSRDSRMNHPIENKWKEDVEIVFQTIRLNQNLICGGFQAGKYNQMKILFDILSKEILNCNCQCNDQDLLNIIRNSGRFTQFRTELDGTIVNSQHTRTFDKETAFEHGNWWMTRRFAGQYSNEMVYPKGIP